MSRGARADIDDRGAWRLVASRDFWVRLRDKGFIVSTAITLTVLTTVILLSAFGSDAPTSFDIGLTGRDPGAIERTQAALVDAAERRGLALSITVWDDDVLAEEAVRSGRLDASLSDDGVLLADEPPPGDLADTVDEAFRRALVAEALDAAGVRASRIEDLFERAAVEVRMLEPLDPDRDRNAGIAFVAVLIAYGQLFGYGVWIATGVIEEKASRVVEILLSAIRPWQQLAGKIAGIGALGIVQLAFIAAFAIGLSLVTGAIDVPGTAAGVALVVLAWFVMGFSFYAGLFAVSGSLVSRTEELQNALVPVNLIIFVSFFVSIGALQDPDSTVAIVASVVPFSAALAMPVRIALGAATPPQIALSIALLFAGTAALVPLSARLYSGAVLKTGSRVKIRDAWRSAGT